MTDTASDFDALVAALEADPTWVMGLTGDDLAEISEQLSDAQWDAFMHHLGNLDPRRATPATFAAWMTADEPEGVRFELWRHTVFMAASLARAAKGDDPHQVHMVGSQYGKTTLLMWFIIWLLDRDPTLRIMYVSYDADRAVDFGGAVRDLVTKYSKRLRFRLRTDKRAKGMWATPEGGGLYCVGILGGITGFPQDVILCDDLFKGWQWAHSKASRDLVWNIYTSQVRMRVQSGTNPIIHVGTRWHEDDVPSRLRAHQDKDPNADRWHIVRLPTFAEAPNPVAKDPLLRLPDPLGRAPGELLCPERFDQKEALARKANLAMYLWAAMEQQRPAPIEGFIFKREWWQLDLEGAFGGSADSWISSWDMKLKGKKSGDYVVGQVWARTGKDLWLLDMMRGQWDQPTVENAVALTMVRWPQIRRHIMENTGNGPEVMTALRTKRPGYVVSDEIAGELGMSEDERAAVEALRRRGLSGIIPNNPKGDKLARAIATTGAVQAGDVHVASAGVLWLPDFIEEMAAFTGSGDTHDDIVDATTQAINYFNGSGTGKIQTATEALMTVRAG